MIYLDNAATTLHKPSQVVSAVTEAVANSGNPSRGTHSLALQATSNVYHTRMKLARLFGCRQASKVVFTANATESLNIAIFGCLRHARHVITTDLEHNSVLRPLYALEEEQALELSFLPADNRGCLDYSSVESVIRPDTQALVCTHASNVTGNVLDLAFLGRLAKAHGLLFIVDASQTAGLLPIDMDKLGIDILCFTGHKSLMGPQGVGGLCLNSEVDITPWKRGGSGVQSFNRHQPSEYPTRLEAGTLNTPGIAGLSAAVDFIENTTISAICAHELNIMDLFYNQVRTICGVTVYGDYAAKTRVPIVSLNIDGCESSLVADILCQDYNIAVRPGIHCAPRMHQALHTENQGAVRFSFSWFNTAEEVTKAAAAIKQIANDSR